MTDIFPISLLVSILLIFISKIQGRRGIINLRKSPQTLHKKSISRFGGVAIFFSLLIVSLFDGSENYEFLRKALYCSSPIFILGILDDFEVKIKPFVRLIIVFPSAFLSYYFLDVEAYSLDILYIDRLFEFKIFSIVFICFAIAGMVNAFNIIDGINGLVLLYTLTICILILLFQSSSSSTQINLFFVAIFFAIFAVFILNFPFGRIFLGDGGAYFLGLMLSIGVIKYYQINDLSPWYVFSVFIYPITDVFISIIRRTIAKVSIFNPENKHLHHLVYKRVKKMNIESENINHALTTLFIFVLYFPFLLSANYFADNTIVLQIQCLVFLIFYLALYAILNPKELAFRKA
tara:strand:+ start:4291 stop:5334 length:1044 start_codon:yes stop_codon:yes gene_type:complete